MTRPIKFRAWDKQQRRMVEVKDIHFHNRGFISSICPNHRAQILIPEQFDLMQFTGLHDKNGNEIWEGDLIKDEHGTVGEVVWDIDEVGFIAKPKQGIHQFNNCFGLYANLHEVVGNIHE